MKKTPPSTFEASFQAAALQHLMVSRIEELKALQRKQEAEGVAPGEKPVITLKSSTSQETSQEIGVQTDIDFSNFDEQAYRVLPETVKDKLYLLENTLVNASANNQAIFYEINSIFQDLRAEHKFDTNQACIQQCIKLAVQCVEPLFTQKTVPSDIKKCFQITQGMFQYYFSYINDDREMLALHLQFRDIRGNNDALIDLIQNEVDGALLNTEETAHKATQTRLSQQPDTLEEQPELNTTDPLNHNFSERWTTLQSASMKPKALQRKLSGLSSEIAQHAYAHKHRMEPIDWKKFLSLALAVEARLMEHIQTSRDQRNIRPLSKSIQRSAHYFRLLYKHYQREGATQALKAELQQSYELMEARATNYEQMLACYYVETSEKTTSIEKENARQVRVAYQSEIQDDTSALCAQYRELNQPLGAAVAAKEISIENRRTLLETNLLAGSKSPYDVYQDARKYLNAVLNQALPKSAYDVTYLHQLDNRYDASVHGISESLEFEQLLSLALGSSLSMLKDAIKLYYDAKCRHADSLYTMHPSDNFIVNERFCTHFRREAYAYLLQSFEPGYEIQNLVLLKQNCLDIIHEEKYHTPFLEALARHQLDAIAPRLAAEAASEQQAKENAEEKHDTGVKASTPKIKILQRKPLKITPVKETLDEKTILERLCAAYAVKSIDFNDYRNKVERKGLTDETVDFLYNAITDPDKHLIIDEQDIDAFYDLCTQLLKYFMPKEKEAIGKYIKQHVKSGNLDAIVLDDKLLLVKSIAIMNNMLKHEHLLSPERNANLLLDLGDTYVYLQSLSAKRSFKDKGEEAYRKLQGVIDDLPEDIEIRWHEFSLNKAIARLTPNSTQLNIEKASAEYSEEDSQKRQNLINQTQLHMLSDESRYKNMISNGQLSTFFEEIHYMLRHTIPQTPSLIAKAVPFQLEIRNFFQQFTNHCDGHFHVLLEKACKLTKQNGERLEDDTYLLELLRFSRYLLTGYAKVSNTADTGIFLEKIGFENSRQPTYETYKKTVLKQFILMCQKIKALDANTSPPEISKQKLDRSFFVPLEIPPGFRERSNKSETAERMLQCIDNHQYVRAIALSQDIPIKDVYCLRACLIRWLLQVMTTDKFTSCLSQDAPIQEGYKEVLKVLKQYRRTLLNTAAKKDLKAPCDLEIKATLDPTEMETPLRVLSLFTTDGKTVKEDDELLILKPST